MQPIKAATLVLDYDLYPRPQIDSQHVMEIAAALEAGMELPPVIYDQKTKRVSDGFHRVRANIKVFGEDCEIMGIGKRYRTERDIFLDAMKYNAAHGKNLSQYDRARCLIIAEKLGIKQDAIADALHVTVGRLDTLRVRKTARTNGNHVALKRTIGHKAGEKLTKPQQEANKKLGGMNQLFYVNQVILLFENDLVDTENEELMNRVEHLKTLI